MYAICCVTFGDVQDGDAREEGDGFGERRMEEGFTSGILCGLEYSDMAVQVGAGQTPLQYPLDF